MAEVNTAHARDGEEAGAHLDTIHMLSSIYQTLLHNHCETLCEWAEALQESWR